MEGREIVEARVPRGTFAALTTYVELLTCEAAEHNLVSQATLAAVWQRHILDSLQLLDLADRSGDWIDLGSGAGLPGIVVAIASEQMVTLIEPRRRRADFLGRAVDALGLGARVSIVPQRSETVRLPAARVISARAVAPLERVFAMAAHFSDRSTQWILPKGRSAAEEVAVAKRTWQGEFRLAPSLTEAGSSIVVARDIRKRGQP